jgi:hypothetical protein
MDSPTATEIVIENLKWCKETCIDQLPEGVIQAGKGKVVSVLLTEHHAM